MTQLEQAGLLLQIPNQGVELQLQPSDPPLVLGRSSDAGVVFTNSSVSAKHARVRHDDQGWLIEDLGSTNGTFVEGHRVSAARIDRSQRIVLGDPNSNDRIEAEPVFIDLPTSPTSHVAPLRRARLEGEAIFATEGLTVETNGHRRLDRVTFALPKGAMLGVLGGSGAGKSTLVRAITGADPATTGRVLFEGYDLYDNFDLLRRRLGYVPQEDILHLPLTVRSTLRYGTRLRMPNAPESEREARIDQVLEELGLSHRADAKVSELSGGQRRRLSVGLELLSRPALLLLDEPTSGLDPANERSLMQLFRQLADGGRTVIVVTHNTESLYLCDQVMVLGRGGVPVFVGAEDELADAFGQPGLIEAFAFVDNHPDPASLRSTETGQNITMAPVQTAPQLAKPQGESRLAGMLGAVEEAGRDAWTLVERSVDILRGDPRNGLIIAAQAPLIAGLLVLLFHGGLLDTATVDPSGAGPSLLLAIVLAVVFIGASSTVREIVKERPIMLREQAVGVSSLSYLASKLFLWGGIIVAQSMVIVLVTTLFNAGPDVGLIHLGPVNEMLWIVILSGLVAVVSGLAISARVSSADKAMTLLPVYLFVQLLLAGMIVPVHRIPMRFVSWFITAKWGLDGVGSVSDLWLLRGQCASVPDDCSANWTHESGNYLLALVALALSLAVVVVITFRSVEKSDPARSLKARRRP